MWDWLQSFFFRSSEVPILSKALQTNKQQQQQQQQQTRSLFHPIIPNLHEIVRKNVQIALVRGIDLLKLLPKEKTH